MATVAERFPVKEQRPDSLSGTPRAHAIDRWIFVFTAASFIVIVLTGFIPDSLMKIELVRTGQRPPFPIYMHMHAVLMGSFLLLLLTQTVLMATGRRGQHMRLGRAAFVLAPALVIVGFLLIPTMYHQAWETLRSAPPEAREKLQKGLLLSEDIKLLQIRIGIVFALLITIGLRARRTDIGLHKRMMILAIVGALPAAFDRMKWLPTSLPDSPLTTDLYPMMAIAPLFVWDVVRNGTVHRAYWIWLGVNLPLAIATYALWDTPWWHATVRQVMGV